MAVPKGTRIGGRQKGTLNKKNQDLLEKAHEYGLDVFEAMMELATKSEDLGVKMTMLKEIASYLYPKKRALEVNATLDVELSKKAEEFAQLPRDEQIRLAEAEVLRLKGSSE